MAKEREWIIWLLPGRGEMLLGLDASQAEQNTRFQILCKVKEEVPMGVWVDVNVVQRLTLGTPNRVTDTWSIKPLTCLIPWNLIAYVQRGKAQTQPVGFVHQPKQAARKRQ